MTAQSIEISRPDALPARASGRELAKLVAVALGVYVGLRVLVWCVIG